MRSRATPPLAVMPGTLAAMQPRASGEDLVTAFVAGEPAAFRRLFDEHHAVIYSFCHRFVDGHAADVTQEVFLAAWRSRERFDPDSGSLGGWLIGIARFKVADHLRSVYRSRSVPSGDLGDLSVGDCGIDDQEIDRAASRFVVATALAQLDEPACSWIRMSFFEGLSHGEIASRSDAPLGTVKSTIRRGLQRIRRDLEAFDADA